MVVTDVGGSVNVTLLERKQKFLEDVKCSLMFNCLVLVIDGNMLT